MEKLKLNNLDFSDGEILDRSQLKKVFGGTGSEEQPCDSSLSGCPGGWVLVVCDLRNPACPYGTKICIPAEDGCEYYG